MKTALILLSALVFIKEIDAGSIFFYMPFVSRSMKITFMPLAEKMAERGHEVVLMLPFPSKHKHPGIREIVVDNSAFEEMIAMISREKLASGGDPNPPVVELFKSAFMTHDKALGHPEFRDLLNKGKKFDVMLVSNFLCGEGAYYVAKKFEASLALYFTVQVSTSMIDWAMGQPHNPSFLPAAMVDYATDMNFPQRVINYMATFALHALRNVYVISKAEELLDKHFPGEVRPSLLDLEMNASVAFGFGHPLLLDGWRPVSHNYVNLGMMNCRKPRADFEDKKLQKFLDEAKDGVIYVSFGSALKSADMSVEKRDILLKVFGSRKEKILWKWETDEPMPNLPLNVLLHKWLPQQDVLGHPNVKMFISHGGQSSFQETLCHQKPAVFVSVFADQPANGKEAERKGFGISLPFATVTEENLANAVKEILTSRKYLARAQELGSLLMDQKEHPLDRAVWWLEHLMRHPHVYEGKNPVHKLAWYQYHSLDVLAFILAIILLIFYLVLKICQMCCRKKKVKFD